MKLTFRWVQMNTGLFGKAQNKWEKTNVSLLSAELPDFPHSDITMVHNPLLLFFPLSFPLPLWRLLSLPGPAVSLSRGLAAILSLCAGPAFSILFPPLDVFLPSIHLPLLILWTRGDLSHHFHFVVLIQCWLNSLTVRKNQLLPTFSHLLSEILNANSNSLKTKGIWVWYSTATMMIITFRQSHKHKYRGRHQRKSMMMIGCLKGVCYTCGILFGGIRYTLIPHLTSPWQIF